MKMKFATVLLLLLPLGLLAQNFQKGQLVTLDGDTLKGYVARAKGKKFVYKADKKGERNFFDEEGIAGYTIGEFQYERHVVDVIMGKFPERRKVYLQVLVDGPVKLLEYTGTGMLGASHTNRFLVHADSPMPWRVPQKDRAFRNQVGMYFEECTMIKDRLKSGELGYEQLNGIVVIYNNWAILEAKKELENMPPVPEDDDRESSEESEISN